MRHLLSISDLDAETIAALVKRSNEFASGAASPSGILRDKVVGIYFRKTSTRTRSAFHVGALRLDAKVYPLGPNDLQLATGETIHDTARVLAGYLDGFVMRTNDSLAEMRAMAQQDTMGIVNALSEESHPTQALTDLSTIREVFGRLEGVHVLYLGEGNSSAHALLMSTARLPGMRVTYMTPAGYGLPQAILDDARPFAEKSGSSFAQFHSMDELPDEVDVVYTTRWRTMGVERGPHQQDWETAFKPFAVTPELMRRVSRAQTVFMHDLPAMRGEDVMDEVLDGPQSRAWRQAQHKMYSAMAVLEWCLADG